MFLRHFSSLHNNNCLTKLLLEKSIALYSTLVTGRRNLAKISDSKSVKTISTSSLYNAMADSSSNPCLKSEPDQEMESISCPDNLKEGVESVSEVTKTISETCLSMPGVDQNSDSITEEDALICSKVSASDETELPPVELSHEEKARQLSKIQIKKDKSEFKKRTAERDTADTHYDSAALIVESMFHFDQFLLSKRLEVALVNVKQEAEIKVETVDVEVQCAENWGLSIFVYDVQQSESVADVSENDPEQVKHPYHPFRPSYHVMRGKYRCLFHEVILEWFLHQLKSFLSLIQSVDLKREQ